MYRLIAITFLAVFLAFFTPALLYAEEPGISIEPENRCSPYNRSDYMYPQSIEDRIVVGMKGLVYSPYTGQYFFSQRETDIEHMVATLEAHDSGLCSATMNTRRVFARDLDNLTLADPKVNRGEKFDGDLGQWLPDQNRCWFVMQVIKVKKKYGLSMDAREAAVALNVIADCSSFDLVYLDGPESGSGASGRGGQSGQPRFIVNRDAVNVRAGPGTHCPVLGYVQRGESYTPDGRNQDSSWLRFPHRGYLGWVYAPLMIREGIAGVPAVPVPACQTSNPNHGSKCPDNCTEAHGMGMSNMTPSHRCWHDRFDRDKDGIGCEK